MNFLEYYTNHLVCFSTKNLFLNQLVQLHILKLYLAD